MRGRSGLLILLLVGLLAVPAVFAIEKKKGPTPAAEPPCSAAHNRQFDFWLGEWEVVDAAGKPAGRNRVVSVFDGCALQENWESAKGARGTSLTVYDAVTGHWHQTWVDDHGGLLELNGTFSDGRMELVGTRPSLVEKGTRLVHRITWTPLSTDKVRQKWEFSKNEGRTWTTLFDGTYVKKK
jgi:hypothetical protein